LLIKTEIKNLPVGKVFGGKGQCRVEFRVSLRPKQSNLLLPGANLHNPRDCHGLRPRNDEGLRVIASLPRQ